MRRAAIAASAIVIGLTTAGAAAATPPASSGGDFYLGLAGQTTPVHLAPREPTPTTFQFGGKIAWQGSDTTLREFKFEVDRNISFDVGGVVVCRVLGLPVTPPPWHHCTEGVVGHGEMEILYSAPESSPIRISSETVVYNGGVKHGLTNLWIRAYFPLPKPHTSLTRIKVRNVRRGRYGWEAGISFPKFAGGLGSLLSFEVTLGKSIIAARCSDGHLSMRGSSALETDSGETEQAFIVNEKCTGR